MGNIPISPTESVFALHYGDYYSPGISFSASATLPSGVSGDIVYVQTVSSHRTRKPVGGNEQVLQGIGLDSEFPYEAPNEGVTSDFPNQPLDVPCNYTSVSADESFTMYLMFKPQVSTGDSIYVPLRKIDWNWSGTGNRGSSCSSWVLTSANPSSPQSLTSEETIDFPEWVTNINQFTFQ
ncbi:MAG: hypothetical protein ACR2N3_04315 [Pyrinomonadaceae bacterium]